MKRVLEPRTQDFEPLAVVLKKIAVDYQITPAQIMSGVNLLPNIDKDGGGFGDLRRIPVLVYRTGAIYHVLAFNSSLNEAYPMFKAVLDEVEQACFDELYNKFSYQECLNFLIENTF